MLIEDLEQQSSLCHTAHAHALINLQTQQPSRIDASPTPTDTI
jgi:hypothetical protein